ncbi:MAG: hypothetical protein HUU38_09045 [Anaerolineales bacterium]|nr:hypothetical protein [Anaerolineales bacterium]
MPTAINPPVFPKCGIFHIPPTLPYPWLATCAGRGLVFVLDGGQRFNAYQVARAIRQQTVHLTTWQANVQIARAFTCHEMTTLLAQTPATSAPIFILDLLATFTDDAVSDAEAHWLFRRCLTRIHHLGQRAPVFVTVPPPRGDARAPLGRLLRRTLQPLPPETFMGKTTPTASDLIRDMETMLAKFRQVLHPTHRTHLDALIVKAKKHTTAISQASHLLPIETIELAMLLEQEIEHAHLAARLAALERKIHALEHERP